MERIFPDTLKITIQEHIPILRLAVRSKNGRGYQGLLVARDGTVYQGRSYLPSTLKNLPYLDGVRLTRSSSGVGFVPIPGMETVGVLLAKVRTRLPHFYATWKTVSCKAFDGRPDFPGALIEATTQRIDKIFFATLDFDRQIEHLAYTLEFLESHPGADPEYIDLSLGEQVAIKFPDQARLHHFP